MRYKYLNISYLKAIRWSTKTFLLGCPKCISLRLKAAKKYNNGNKTVANEDNYQFTYLPLMSKLFKDVGMLGLPNLCNLLLILIVVSLLIDMSSILFGRKPE